jgi:6-hydroxytryprostatin B O-methyltransferase
MSSNNNNNNAMGLDLATQLDTLTADLGSQSKTFSEYVRSSASAHLPGDPSAEFQAAKEKLLEDTSQIFNLVSGPMEYIQNVLIGVS